MSTLRAEYEAGAGMVALAHAHRLSFYETRRRLRAAGASIRTQGCPAGTIHPKHKNRKIRVEQVPALVAMAREKGNVAAALVFGLTRQRVSQIVLSRTKQP